MSNSNPTYYIEYKTNINTFYYIKACERFSANNDWGIVIMSLERYRNIKGFNRFKALMVSSYLGTDDSTHSCSIKELTQY